MNRLITFLGVGCFLAASVASAQSEIGTWKLNTSKSRYTGITPRQSMSVTIESQDGGIKVHTVGVAGNGSAIDYSYSAKYDGKDNPISGSGIPNGADTVAVKRINANTTEDTFKKGGKVVNTGSISVSADGKVRTIAAKGTGSDGKPTSIRAVYEKQ